MNRKGFTLVELLAVIAILAILVIIALPNVMGMFNEAKKNSFLTEVKTIYQMAQQQWISDSMFSTGIKEYGRCNGCSYKELSLSGRQEIEYYIKIDKAGNIIKYKASDGTYQFEYSGSGLAIENIKNADAVADLNDNEIISVGDNGDSETYVYYSKDSNGAHIGRSGIGNPTFDNYQDAITQMGYNFFLKSKVENNIVTESYVGFIYNGNVYYLQGGDPTKYNDNKNKLFNIFGEYCSTNTNGSKEFVLCYHPDDEYTAYADNTGKVDVQHNWYCEVHSNNDSVDPGRSLCFND